jgi:hypothetical protein
MEANNQLLNQVAKDFFELGEAFAYSQTAFSHVRYQAKVYGGEFERACNEIQDKYRDVSILDGERLEASRVRKDLVKVDLDLHRLQSKVVSVFLVSRNSGYDVPG